MEPERGYEHAKKSLKKKYGNKYKIGMAYIEKAMSWPPIKSEDSSAPESFSVFLTGCCNTMEDIDYMKGMDHPKNVKAEFEPRTDSTFSLQHVSTEFVKSQLRSLRANKAVGLDQISARLLKDSADVLSPILRNLFNLSIDQKKFPNNWKSVKVIALFKSGDASECDNYRPISILPTASKILERAIHMQLYDHLQREGLLYARQFVSGRSYLHHMPCYNFAMDS